MDAFDEFGRLASEERASTETAGRYLFQAASERQIIDDVADKLRLASSNSLLEIGCGAGTLIAPLARRVHRAVGIDHPSFRPYVDGHGVENLTFAAGRWPDADVRGPFDRILVYSVLQYLAGEEEVHRFLDACIASLSPDGWLLIGDLPNHSSKARFTATAWGQEFVVGWRKSVSTAGGSPAEISGGLGSFVDDDFVVGLVRRFRRLGHESYLLPQPAGLPFSHTREDLLIWRRPR